MSAHKILVGPSVMGKGPLTLLSAAGFEVVANPYKRKYTRAELIDLLPGISGILAGLEALDREVLERSQLKVISRVGSGMTNVDQAAAADLGIKVYSTPDGPTLAVAEMVVGSLLCLLRRIQVMDRDLHAGKWTKIVGWQLAGRQVAVVGYGRIGRAVARLLSALGARILAVDPHVEAWPAGVEHATLDEALKTADVITLHSSGEDLVLGALQFAAMKKGVFVLNAGRAGLLDEAALAEHVKNGTVAGAWLDVFPKEPYAGMLCGMDNMHITPHVASYTEEGRLRMETEAVENLLKGFGVAVPAH